MKIGYIVKDRVGGTRLRKKSQLKIFDKTIANILSYRLRQSNLIKIYCHAIPDTKENDLLVKTCDDKDVKFFRGSEVDLIEREIGAAEKFGIDIIVDITADCPLIDAQWVNAMLKEFIEKDFDYLSNVVTRTWPDGFDIQIYKLSVLKELDEIVVNKIHRQHAGISILNYSGFFSNSLKIGNIPCDEDLSHWLLTLDYYEDYLLIKQIFEHFGNLDFNFTGIINYVKKNKRYLTQNSHLRRKSYNEQ